VARLLRVQLRAMACERFDVAIRRNAGEMIRTEGQGAIEIDKTNALGSSAADSPLPK